jgi:hypothetical protein
MLKNIFLEGGRGAQNSGLTLSGFRSAKYQKRLALKVNEMLKGFE